MKPTSQLKMQRTQCVHGQVKSVNKSTISFCFFALLLLYDSDSCRNFSHCSFLHDSISAFACCNSSDSFCFSQAYCFACCCCRNFSFRWISERYRQSGHSKWMECLFPFFIKMYVTTTHWEDYCYYYYKERSQVPVVV